MKTFKVHQTPKPKFKIGEICIVQSTPLDLIIITAREFGKHGYKNQWVYYFNPLEDKKTLIYCYSNNKRIIFGSFISENKKFYTTEENIEKLSDEQKIELL